MITYIYTIDFQRKITLLLLLAQAKSKQNSHNSHKHRKYGLEMKYIAEISLNFEPK